MKKLKFLLILVPVFMAFSCSPKLSQTATSGYANEMVEEAADWDYALLHVYRPGSLKGAVIGYDVHLGDELIGRVKNKWKTTVEVRDFGQSTVWARTESKTEIPINLERGREYYVRCGVKMGIAVGRPSLELVSKRTGKPEFDAIK